MGESEGDIKSGTVGLWSPVRARREVAEMGQDC